MLMAVIIMRTFLITSLYLAIAWVFVYPIKSNVTIVKDEITSNRPFAGRINDQLVGSRVCCEYWLEKDKQPEVAEYFVIATPLSWIMGMPLYVEQSNAQL